MRLTKMALAACLRVWFLGSSVLESRASTRQGTVVDWCLIKRGEQSCGNSRGRKFLIHPALGGLIIACKCAVNRRQPRLEWSGWCEFSQVNLIFQQQLRMRLRDVLRNRKSGASATKCWRRPAQVESGFPAFVTGWFGRMRWMGRARLGRWRVEILNHPRPKSGS